ncbi:FAD binding domain-containing protein [Pseudaestuariivita rosea]|uniref:FAD binding domain-containing protein n=1 Tax=Pseudaestuariivita rosea TaxID=2763263 RepID=UPI001ABA722E|nr:FAD binding domain-containing protein [Pseudaestuariivita rosea]
MSAFDITEGGTPVDGAAWIAGGTTMVDLMKLGATAPSRLFDLGAQRDALSGISETSDTITLGALTTMADAAKHPAIRGLTAVHTALVQAASPQIREMATLGGNLLQRTRCSYFRDTRQPCNKRVPGSGCPAIGGEDGHHAVLGGSAQCIATYPGDFAVVCVALGAEITIRASDGSERKIPVQDLHRRPGATPHTETALQTGDLITAIHLPKGGAQSYIKIRDRASYAFATASAAVVLHMDGAMVTSARIALGGLATVPWRAATAEHVLKGSMIDQKTAFAAGEAALQDAHPTLTNAHRVELGIRAVAKAILSARGNSV